MKSSRQSALLAVGAVAALGVLSVAATVGAVALASSGGSLVPSELALRLAAYHRISPELAAGIEQTARAVGTDPRWLAGLISLETAGTFDPAVRNRVSKAVGLIQATKTTAERLGTTTNELAELSAVSQLRYVRAYLDAVRLGKWPDDPRPFPLDTLQRLAFSVFWLPGRDLPLSTPLPEHLRSGNEAVNVLGDYLSAVRSRIMPA